MTHKNDVLSTDPLCAYCQQIANRTGQAAYVIGRLGKQDRVMQSGMFIAAARQRNHEHRYWIRWVSWPRGWYYAR